MSCKTEIKEIIDVQGHRGTRGHYPENTIPSFLAAIEMGVHTLEMDVAISKDKKVIVSHEPFMHHVIALDPTGNEILETNQLDHNIYQLTASEIKSYDVGLKPNPKFPNQKRLATYKPTLEELFDAVEAKYPNRVNYNIEIKRLPEWDDIYHPDANEFSELVVQTILSKNLEGACNLQSFDLEVMRYIRKNHPLIPLAYLTSNKTTFRRNISELGFTPDIYSPQFKLLSKDLAEFCTENDMKLIPWTVNEKADIKKCLLLQVDGIISDYPDRVFEVIDQIKKQ